MLQPQMMMILTDLDPPDEEVPISTVYSKMIKLVQ